jgi:cell filamentation protein
MEDYTQYDITENDPYLIDNSTCLKNLLGFTDTRELNSAEAAITSITIAELAKDPVTPATFDLAHLCKIHERLFSEIYAFAGKPRTVEISKGRCLFLPYKFIESEFQNVTSYIQSKNCFAGSNLSTLEFGEEAGFILGKINLIHCFREGNGRAQRIFIDQLAETAGDFAIEWSAISQEAMGQACRVARNGDDPEASNLKRLISLHTVQL